MVEPKCRLHDLYGMRVDRNLRTADWRHDRICNAELGMREYGQPSNNNFTSLQLQHMVHCKLAERPGAALLVLIPGPFLYSSSALRHFALVCCVPH
jgi:hypothetical protein